MSKSSCEELVETRDGRDAGFFDLTSVEQLTPQDLDLIYDLARVFRKTRTEKLDLCKGSSIIHAFFEPSTRTLASFDLAAKNLSMDTNNVGGGSSVSKGESFLDTAQTLDSYNLDVMTIRCAQAGVPEMLARHTRAAVINAGDGWHEHPTQALMDVLTMLDHFGSRNLEGKTVTIIGDLAHSRVFGSLVRLLKMTDADIRVVAPYTLIPAQCERFDVQIFDKVEPALKDTHVVYALRVQEERGSGGYIPSLREYSKKYGISRQRLNLADEKAILMHPGPVRRDIDIHSALVTLDTQSHILHQVENGMAVRKALLWLLCHRYDQRLKEYKRL